MNVVLIVLLVVGGLCCLGGGSVIALMAWGVSTAQVQVQDAQERFVSSNNLKMIGLAMITYHDVNGSFPPAYLADENGQPRTSWRTLLLPYLEENGRFAQYQQNEAWNSPANSIATQAPVPAYVSPRATNPPGNYTNYVVIAGVGSAFEGDKAARMSDLHDGTSNTLLVVEIKNSNIPWAEPRDLSLDNLSFAPDGVNAIDLSNAILVTADGAVQTRADITEADIRALVTARGGEIIAY